MDIPKDINYNPVEVEPVFPQLKPKPVEIVLRAIEKKGDEYTINLEIIRLLL